MAPAHTLDNSDIDSAYNFEISFIDGPFYLYKIQIMTKIDQKNQYIFVILFK